MRRIRPLWRRADGRPISEDPAYRRRKFTESGELVGRAVDMTVRIDLWVELPTGVDGVRASIELADFNVTAHTYATKWGRIASVDQSPLTVGRLPEWSIALSDGEVTGRPMTTACREAYWQKSPGREDVVRIARRAFGLECRYRILVEGFASDGGNRTLPRIAAQEVTTEPEEDLVAGRLKPPDRHKRFACSPGNLSSLQQPQAGVAVTEIACLTALNRSAE